MRAYTQCTYMVECIHVTRRIIHVYAHAVPRANNRIFGKIDTSRLFLRLSIDKIIIQIIENHAFKFIPRRT